MTPVRKAFSCLAILSMLAAAHGRAAQDQPQFRGRVELLTIYVAAVDGQGRPVDDLRPGDFTVKVDGKARPVVTTELIKVDRTRTPARPDDPLITTNATARNARHILIAVDQTLISPGSLTPLLRTASRFVDRLAPDDAVAFIVFPQPGPHVDFTTDKARVRKEMERLIGQPPIVSPDDLTISLSEAIEMTEGAERLLDADDSSPEPFGGPTMRRVLERGCRGVSFEELQNDAALLKQCRRDIYTESLRLAQEARQDAKISTLALEGLLRDLIPLEGPKSMILLSGGLVNDNPLLLDGVAQFAAEGHTAISVVAADRDRVQENANLARARPPFSLVDRSLESQGLEIVADSTGGTLYRGIASGEGVFQRIESELSAWYFVAVERQTGDPERQRIDVAVKRRGVTVRANKTAVNTVARANRPQDALLSDALSLPFAVAGVPLRLSTFTQREAAQPGKYRLRLAAQIGQPGEPAAEFAVGFAVTDDMGRVVTKGGSRRTLSPPVSGPNQLLQYDTAFLIDPGSYSVRFGVVDKDGRRGTVVRRVDLPRIGADDFGTSDLVVGNLPGEGDALVPAVEPQVTASELAAYLELYHAGDPGGDVSVRLEIAEGQSSPALVAQPLTLRPGGQPSVLVASGVIEATIAPGRYLARATIRRDGGVVTTLSRPFVLLRDPAVVSRVPARPKESAMSLDMHRKAASYVAGVVGGLRNIVAQEEFVLSKPNRRVVSDVLLVLYPGTDRDLILYRDVRDVDGKPLEGRPERLVDLFVKPTDGLRDRARQIMIDADAYVPSAFNPVLVIGFLQADFQARFEWTAAPAGRDWPAGVTAATFVEKGRPTLLRTGPLGNIDVPTRGTAWIEDSTGRVLQTELQLGRSRSPLTMITRFTLDDRLQVMVPESMKTENPSGTATYTNVRRFAVDTQTVVPIPR